MADAPFAVAATVAVEPFQMPVEKKLVHVSENVKLRMEEPADTAVAPQGETALTGTGSAAEETLSGAAADEE